MVFVGFSATAVKTVITGVTIALVIAAVYTLYFAATYLLAKRYILNE